MNKVGDLKPDADGYYTMVVGALNMFNSAGEFYQAEEAKDLFEGSSQLMRRVKRGALRGEYGHPKPMPGQSEKSFAARCLAIDEDRAACHHRELWLDFDNVKDKSGKTVIAIMSKVYPSGPFGPALEKSLQNKHENVCFSIRAFTDDRMVGGINHRILRNIVTFDYVNEPGMGVAEKYFSPALEGLSDMIVTRTMLEDGLKENQLQGLATESAILTANELFQSMRWNVDPGAVPAWAKW
jgi:hypothetical protein